MHPTSPTKLAPPRERQPFRLTRYFSWASLLGIVAVTSALIGALHRVTEQQIVDHEGRANADQARTFANGVWGRYRSYLFESVGRSREALLADPMHSQLDAELRAKMRGLKIAKVKLYNTAGITVYSTDAAQVGEDKRSNAGFASALAGRAVSQVTFRERFDAFEGQISNRSLIASYVPVRSADSGPVEAVIELYSDVTELQEAEQQALFKVAAMTLSLLGLLYLFLYAVVRKADRIIAAQEGERAAREAQMRHHAYHDNLTGLPNRAYFGERLREALALATRHEHHCAVMFIDLDRFKIVNDSLGHQAGDTLLTTTAQRIQSCMRETDLLFRMGGDEFTVILPNIAAPEDAAVVARRVLQAMAAPVDLHGHELSVSASIGIAVCPVDGTDAETVLKNADAAMYSAKDGGRSTYAFYRTDMNRRAKQRLGREAELKRAFQAGEFTLHYQPRVHVRCGRVLALEALLRWDSPVHGLVPPGEFIAVLEESGLINMVGEWVLRTACQQARCWHERGHPGLRVSINVSARQFQAAAFAPTVQRVLAETGVQPQCVELELTESMLMADTEQATATIAALKAVGVKLAIDDFGTGYSSLNYLRRFEVDYLKIDRSFVAGIGVSQRDRALTRAIVELAKALGIAVVGEGVETEEQARHLREAACDELQGFLFARPMPASEVEGCIGKLGVADTALLLGRPSQGAAAQATTLPA